MSVTPIDYTKSLADQQRMETDLRTHQDTLARLQQQLAAEQAKPPARRKRGRIGAINDRIMAAQQNIAKLTQDINAFKNNPTNPLPSLPPGTPITPVETGGDLNSFFGSLPAAPTGSNPNADRAVQMQEELYKKNTDGTLQNFGTAAGRLRERLAAAGQSTQNQIKRNAIGEGGVASGTLARNLRSSANDTQNAYAQGMVGLSSEFENRRLQGLGQAAQNAAAIQAEGNFGRELGQRNYETQLGSALSQWQEALRAQLQRESFASNERIGSMNANSAVLAQLPGWLQEILG